MSAANTVSEAYLMGLRDERAMLRAMVQGGDDVASEAPLILANIKTTLARGFSGDMAEYMRGSRDFWANQCAKLASNGSAAA